MWVGEEGKYLNFVLLTILKYVIKFINCVYHVIHYTLRTYLITQYLCLLPKCIDFFSTTPPKTTCLGQPQFLLSIVLLACFGFGERIFFCFYIVYMWHITCVTCLYLNYFSLLFIRSIHVFTSYKVAFFFLLMKDIICIHIYVYAIYHKFFVHMSINRKFIWLFHWVY